MALQLTLLEVVTPLAGWMLTPLTLGALLETACTLSEESYTLAIGIRGRDGALHHIGGADAAGAQRHRRPAAQARARAEIPPARS